LLRSVPSKIFNDNVGLLQDVDVEKDDYYTRDLRIDDLALLREKGLTWKAAELDAHALGFLNAADYLQEVTANLKLFSETNITHDRNELFWNFLI
jgi:hypothetical protein